MDASRHRWHDPVLWAAAFVAYDLCYYFSHRFGHEWRILWASHVVHHSSEAFNLSTALRQTSTGWLNGIFYLPMYAIGVPLEVMLSVGSLNLIYQFWVHTEHIRRLGWLEWVLVTPSTTGCITPKIPATSIATTAAYSSCGIACSAHFRTRWTPSPAAMASPGS